MSDCRYYKIEDGIPICKHPNIGEFKTMMLRTGDGSGHDPCEVCKMIYSGLYPSEIPHLILKTEDDNDLVIENPDGSTIYIANGKMGH